MTARERIQKAIREHDGAIEESRQAIDCLTGGPTAFPNSGHAYRAAKSIIKHAGLILSRLAQRREAVSNLELLDYHASKNPQAANEVGL